MSVSQKLRSLGVDITTTSVHSLLKSYDRIAFFSINNYIGKDYSLGEKPQQEAITVAQCLRKYGYQVYYMLNAEKKDLINKLKYFVSETPEELVIYYTGLTMDPNLDEEFGTHDESFVLIDGMVTDEEYLEILNEKNPLNKVVLLTDSCKEGSAWDVENNKDKLPAKILSITTKQLDPKAEPKFGFFANCLLRLLKAEPNLSANDARNKLIAMLEPNGQTLTISTTTPVFIHDALF